MIEAGMLSIVRRGTTYQVRYASANPQGVDRQPYLCPNEDGVPGVIAGKFTVYPPETRRGAQS